MTTEEIQRLSISEKEKVFIQIYKNGKTNLQAVARMMLVSFDVVKNWRVTHFPNFGKVAKKKKKRRKRNPQKTVIPANIEKLEMFKKMYSAKKYTQLQIAESLGISIGTIGRWKKAFFPKNNFRAFTHPHFLPLVDQFKKLYEMRIFTDLEICEKLKICRGTLHRWKKYFYPEGKKWKYNQFVKFYKSGYSLETCCYFLHVTRTTGLRYLSTHREKGENTMDSTTASFASSPNVEIMTTNNIG